MLVGFGTVGRGQRVEFQIFGPHGADPLSLVTFHRAGDIAAVVMGKLYYRNEKLAAALPKIPAELAEAAKGNDAALAAAAYIASGREGIAKLEGDFSLVVWDGEEGRLVGSRDPNGGYPLFWAKVDGAILIGTCMRPLVRSPQQSINPDYLAEFFMLPGAGREELDDVKTIFSGVNRIRPGEMIEVRLADQTVTTTKFWDWIAHIGKCSANTIEDMGREYIHILRDAVKQRMVGKVTAHVSGGMDSTTIALIAGEFAAGGLGDGPVQGLSLVYEKLSVLSRETSYVDAAHKVAKGLVQNLVNGDDCLDYDGYTNPPLFDEPCPWMQRLAMNRLLVDYGAKLGMNTMLTGVGADDIVDVPPMHIADWLRRGRILKAWKESGVWARAFNCNRWGIFKPYGLSGIAPAWMRFGIGAHFRGGFARWNKQTGFTIAPWVRPEFAKKHRMKKYGVRNLWILNSKYPTLRLSMALSTTEARRGDMSRMWLGAPLGMHISHPFFDPRIVCYGLSVPPELCCLPGKQKPMLAEATRGLLPDEIRLRPGKGHFNEVYFMGLARHIKELMELARTTPVDDVGAINRDILLECMTRASVGAATDFRGIDRMNQALAYLKWRSQLDAWEKNDTTPTASIALEPAGRWQPGRRNVCAFGAMPTRAPTPVEIEQG